MGGGGGGGTATEHSSFEFTGNVLVLGIRGWPTHLSCCVGKQSTAELALLTKLIWPVKQLYYTFATLYLCFVYFAVVTWLSVVWDCGPTRVMASSILRFLEHTQRRTSLKDFSGREIGPSQRLLPDKTHNRQTMSPVGFEFTIPASERLQTHASDHAATWTGCYIRTQQLFG
jgi:hypothetical protein